MSEFTLYEIKNGDNKTVDLCFSYSAEDAMKYAKRVFGEDSIVYEPNAEQQHKDSQVEYLFEKWGQFCKMQWLQAPNYKAFAKHIKKEMKDLRELLEERGCFCGDDDK